MDNSEKENKDEIPVKLPNFRTQELYDDEGELKKLQNLKEKRRVFFYIYFTTFQVKEWDFISPH